ncbi:hypothetical protein Hypma_003478 [Hypsizygus marmoreus]|uniref:FIST domain-containing protein n=1 Tax=Hypsizygus marmoreus TaxID=39966 RepID=A0A369J4J0_HYPMA|nr:hypothetical protein Hypma_003478 [Hypsizygus marmoreus]
MALHTLTILSRSSAPILHKISCLSKLYADCPLVFALSPNVEPPELSKLVKALTTFSTQAIGCLSAPLPDRSYQNLIACSLAVFKPEDCVVFRSTIPGRPTPQVGRWHAFRNKDEAPTQNHAPPEGAFNWADIWDGSAGGVLLPPSLQQIGPGDVSEVVYFSDNSPEGLSNSLQLKGGQQLGLIATSTPFVTGRPVTLFHNRDIYDSGAVGIVIKRLQKGRARTRTEFLGAIPLSSPMTVTHCEGNLVNSLDGSNPTQLLLNAIQKSGMEMDASGSFKNDEKFLLGTIRSGMLGQIYNITAGDPHRGSISLESQNAPMAGTQVQFFHRPKSTIVKAPTRSSLSSINSIQFLTAPETTLEANTDQAEETESVKIISNTFLASSENGFIICRSDHDEAETAWTCTVPGGVATLEWPTL